MRRIHTFLPFFIFGGVLLAQTSKLAPELQNADSGSQVKIIVQYDHDPVDADHQKVVNLGGKHQGTLHSVHGAAYLLPASALEAISSDPTVKHVSVDHKLSAKNDYSAAAVNAPTAWATYNTTGVGVGVAVIDSGLSAHPDFASRIVYSQDFTGGNGQDAYGHGTHVGGIIAGNGAHAECSVCTRDLKGIAPGANLINLRVLDANGESSDSMVISAIEAAINLKSTYNIRVINLSLGRPVFESYTQDPLCQAVESAWKAGIVVVVAAGNDGRVNVANNTGYGMINAPGNDPYVITVGAMKTLKTYTRNDDLMASYSSKGPSLIDNIAKPDIVAPGNMVSFDLGQRDCNAGD